ncbi:zinc carboxypeptidase family protein (macronuclear) [Tetrahymena thermophila SB210]|uniref:Zinc carboxypeptidase family protein n=1 Tax=Tetrahymena thermophila (strain SB210) TaxID=312017 RepID=I7LVG9_TETTS|nr:zinc carboxypeptidase family protein [Tetrahymena thermophila SB210]EAR98207.2 zinc carboxypeptidase family protein [Tetrahymena thermophila SB210]|eukprot:XP_001018452.2 zinc carboxypeptidase family protein [Tetrahymena thermophila SB210]
MNISSIHRRQYNQYQLEKVVVLPLIQKESSKENPLRDDEVQSCEEKMKQTLKLLDKNFQRLSLDNQKQLERLYPLTPLQRKQINEYNLLNQLHLKANKKKPQIVKVEKTEPNKKAYLIQESKSLNNINQIGLSIQQKKITQQLKRLEKYTSQTLILPTQSTTQTEQATNTNQNLNTGNEVQQSYNQYNSNSGNNYNNSNNNNNNYYQSCISQSSQNSQNFVNNYENVGIKKEVNRSQNQNESYNNFINTYISCFNGKNFTQFIKKYDKDLLTVYDCFMNINFQIPYHMTSDNKRRIRNLLDRYKNLNKRVNNSAFRHERNVQFKQKQFKMFDQFQNLSDKDKFNLLRMSSFPPLKLFPTLSMLKYEVDDTAILFDSKFESGNLRRVYKVAENEYNLILEFDSGTDHFTQWYFFRTLNIKKNTKVKFNIVNLYKERSLYEKGLRPVVFSQKAFEQKGEKWHRDCENIQYARNEFKRINFSNMISNNNIFIYQQLNQNNQQNSIDQSCNNQINQNTNQTNNNNNNNNNNNINTNSTNCNSNLNNNSNNNAQNKKRNYRNSINMPSVYYSTLSFTYTYKYDDDIVYFAHSVPYTYSNLTHYLSKLNQHQQQNKFYKVESLTTTLIGNKVFCISISDKINEPSTQNQDKKEVIICSRVHPGETNASWIMKGMLDFLLSDHEIAVELRKKYIFRMIPMLNPDGVRYGNYRCCLFGNDLNRKWKKALDYIHAPIHSVKKLIQKLQETEKQESCNDLATPKQEKETLKSKGKVELLCDIHGHSKSMGAFIYGCQYRYEDENTNKPNYKELNNLIKVFPYLYSQRKQYFSFEKCCFAVQRDKLGTARVVGFQELQIPKSYTLECSFLGFKNPQITTQQEDGQSNLLEMNVEHFEEVGREFLITLHMNQDQQINQQITDLFTFKDQQIQNTQILIEDLQKKISSAKPFEMQQPQFLNTGFNYKASEKINQNNNKKEHHLHHQHQDLKPKIYEENDTNNTDYSNKNFISNTINLPYIMPIQKKKSFDHANDLNSNEENILENLTKRLKYQLKSQRSQEYNFQSIKFQEPDLSQLQFSNKNQHLESSSNNQSEHNMLNKKILNQDFQKNPALIFNSENIKNSNFSQHFGKFSKQIQNKPQRFQFKEYTLEKVSMSAV